MTPGNIAPKYLTPCWNHMFACVYSPLKHEPLKLGLHLTKLGSLHLAQHLAKRLHSALEVKLSNKHTHTSKSTSYPEARF